MKSLTEHLWFEIKGRRGFINITPTVEELVSRSGVKKVFAWSTPCTITASVFINDDNGEFDRDRIQRSRTLPFPRPRESAIA